jgi:superfamily II DNA or RNA helicase
MSIKALLTFQDAAVASGVAVFSRAKELLDAVPDDADSRTQTIRHNGYLLIEAPTGSGKTLMAGHIVERFSQIEAVVWLWFAPFKGVVGQTDAFLRDQYKGLRLRELSADRDAGKCRAGDVFVTTWQTVATRVKDRRNVRRDSELNPSVDNLVRALRLQGLRLGVVVDEAHHGFGRDTQAAIFFRDVLKPDYTILVTATPDDADIAEFKKEMNIADDLAHIQISRADAVLSGLIKAGVKCAAYVVEPEKRRLVDLEDLALRDAVAAHRRISRLLAEAAIPLTPLLLVQVDSKDEDPAAKTEASVKRVRERLLKLGFSAEQIRTHTAKEPDAELLTVANDESCQVLIFKMAVALGFDAPRAFTLVSMRASRDPDFGVQLVGRILRVHRRLQAPERARKLPEELRYGYVFLADLETQEGLDIAGQRINRIQTQYATVSSTTMVVRVAGRQAVQAPGKDGQLMLWPNVPEPAAGVAITIADDVSAAPAAPAQAELDLGAFFAHSEPGLSAPAAPAASPGVPRPAGPRHYRLRPDVPRRLKTQVVCPENEVTEADCANRFVIDARHLLEAITSRIGVQRRTLDVFTRQLELSQAGAALEPEKAKRLAERALIGSDMFDARELRHALLRRMQAAMRDEMIVDAEDPAKVQHFLNVILAVHPNLLYEAQKQALAQTAIVQDTGDLPEEWASDTDLPASPGNAYGVIPAGLNLWEESFVRLLDTDPNRQVRWWHRNLPRKPWSVNVLLPNGRGFFPDFVIGIEGRKTEGGILLADPKWGYERLEEVPKTQAVHGVYGRVLVLSRRGDAQWQVVRYDEATRRPVLDRPFRLADAAGFE